MKFVNRGIALASHISTLPGELVFEQMLGDGSFISTAIVRPNPAHLALLGKADWKHHLGMIVGMRGNPTHGNGRRMLDFEPGDAAFDPLGAGSQIAIHRKGHLLAINGPCGDDRPSLRFTWPGGDDKAYFGPICGGMQPLGPEIVPYAIWLLTVAYRPFTVERQNITDSRITLTVA